ncbi:MAG: SPFH domain-containing protein [Azospirillaceae bacterium]|nr:SPFH domain-containing protein [Azospirillaceae bacterium]
MLSKRSQGTAAVAARVLPPARDGAAPPLKALLAGATLIYFALAIILPAAVSLPWAGTVGVVAMAAREAGLAGSGPATLIIAGAATLLVWGAASRHGDPRAAARSRILRVARRGIGRPRIQSMILIVFSGLATILQWRFRPVLALGPDPLSLQQHLVTASLLMGAIFPVLVIERRVAAIPGAQLAEAPVLAVLLFVPVCTFAVAGGLEILAGLGFGWVYGVRLMLAAFVFILAGELAVRNLAVWFLPPADPAQPAIASLVAAGLRPHDASPQALAQTIRDRFGIDFSRSWALTYLRRATVPVIFGLLLLCWLLTGVVVIGLDERGSYERFGAPVAMLAPGLHLVLPWPFAVIRRAELGIVHSIVIGGDDVAPPQGGTDTSPPERRGAEDPPPPSANRLWDQVQNAEASTIIARAEAGRQSFETIGVTLHVLYRIGLDDAAARRALYGAVAVEPVIRAVAGRQFVHFFATETLSDALSADRETLAETARAQLQAALDRLGGGVEIVAVVIEAIRPPGGAAVAYHNVQAAEIAAMTAIATERGKAESLTQIARRDAHGATDAARAAAAERTGAAAVDASDFQADHQAYRAGRRPFLMERFFTNLRGALANMPLEIIDNRLDGADAATIDLRSFGATAAAGPEPRNGKGGQSP